MASSHIPADIAFSDLAPNFNRLREAVRVALDTRPKARMGARSCAREFGFDKSIGWKIYQIAYSNDFVTALAAIPGARGWEIVLGKFEGMRVAPDQIARIKSALAEFERQLADRRIDRSMLSGMAAAIDDTEESRRQMLRLRKQGSDAMAVILGVHVELRIGTYLLAPSKTPGMIDVAASTIISGLERRRPGPPWELFKPIGNYDSAGKPIDRPAVPLSAGDRAPLIEDLSSVGIDASEVVARHDLPGAFDFVGRRPTRGEPLTLVFAEVAEAVGPARQQPDEKDIEMSMPITKPTTTAVLDILLHRDLPRGGDPTAALYASSGVVQRSPSSRERLRLSLETTVSKVPSLQVAEASGAVNDRYAELVRRIASSRGMVASDFDCFRIVVAHPPVPCTVMMRWDLA